MPRSKPPPTMGRPPRNGETATKSLSGVKLTADEYEAAKAAAAKAGLTLSAYVRERIVPERKVVR
jgi:hypothetical protein